MLEGRERGGQTTSFDAGVQMNMPKPEIRLPTPGQEELLGRWNTTNLGLRFGVDASSAAAASALVAPIICVIDR